MLFSWLARAIRPLEWELYICYEHRGKNKGVGAWHRVQRSARLGAAERVLGASQPLFFAFSGVRQCVSYLGCGCLCVRLNAQRRCQLGSGRCVRLSVGRRGTSSSAEDHQRYDKSREAKVCAKTVLIWKLPTIRLQDAIEAVDARFDSIFTARFGEAQLAMLL